MEKRSNASSIRSKLAEALDSANQDTKDTPTSKTMSATETLALPATPEAPVALSPEKIVNGSVLLAAGAGAIPVPVWDTAVLFGVQLKMLADLSVAYGKPFNKNLGKSALAALLGGMAPALLARGAVGGVLKAVPGVGSILGTVAQPVFAAAVTYGVGKVFIKHYESGGTLLTFNAKDFKDTFTAEVKTGMKKVSEFKY